MLSSGTRALTVIYHLQAYPALTTVAVAERILALLAVPMEARCGASVDLVARPDLWLGAAALTVARTPHEDGLTGEKLRKKGAEEPKVRWRDGTAKRIRPSVRSLVLKGTPGLKIVR